jgi:K+/H+ antiporter YhaU regulatory subunit KhtT
MFIDCLLDVARENVESARQDHVLLAIDERDKAILVDEARNALAAEVHASIIAIARNKHLEPNPGIRILDENY